MSKAVLFLVQEGHSFEEVGNMTLPQFNMLCEYYSSKSKVAPIAEEEEQEGQSFGDVFSSL